VLYPDAVSNDDRNKSCIKLFLSLCDWEAHPPKGKLYAKYTVCVREGKVGHFEEVTGKLPFWSSYIMTISWCNRSMNLFVTSSAHVQSDSEK
jgi:hypothetical protein